MCRTKFDKADSDESSDDDDDGGLACLPTQLTSSSAGKSVLKLRQPFRGESVMFAPLPQSPPAIDGEYFYAVWQSFLLSSWVFFLKPIWSSIVTFRPIRIFSHNDRLIFVPADEEDEEADGGDDGHVFAEGFHLL